jgi:uncharacterized protein
MADVYQWRIDARCPGSASWAVLDPSGQIVACHLSEALARFDSANRNSAAGNAIAGGLGVPQDLPGVTPATGDVADAPLRGGNTGGGAQPGAVLTPDQGGPSKSAAMGPLAGPGGWTAGAQPPYGPARGLYLPEIETRRSGMTWPLEDFEVRASGDGMKFRGYAAVFDTPSEPLGPPGHQFIETIKPGAFARSLNGGRDIKMFVNHDPGKLLATRKAGTLQLTEDSRGLLTEADLPMTSAGKDLAILAGRGDVDSMSFTFKVEDPNKRGQDWSKDGTERRLNTLALYEVSPMYEWAAYPSTTASVRSLRQTATRLIHDSIKRAYSESASDAATGAGILSSLLYLLSTESDEPDQVAMIQSSIDSLTQWLAAERAEVDGPDDLTLPDSIDDGMRHVPIAVVRRRLALLETARA